MARQEYTVLISATAEKELRRLDPPVRQRILETLESLGRDPSQGKALRGPLTGKRSVRVGREYRVIFTVDHTKHQLTVVAVAHRKEVYRR